MNRFRAAGYPIAPFALAYVLLAAVVVSPLFGETPTNEPEFALQDGDTVVFLGDSITAARTYGKLVENFTLLRFPDRKIRFYNAGRGGDTAEGGLARLERDVFPRRPSVLIVAYGVNDIGWGLKADEEHKQQYLAGIRGIVEMCRENKIRVYICSAAVTAADPAESETSFLQKMCDEGMALAQQLGEHSIDVQRTMRKIQLKIAELNKNQPMQPGKEPEKFSLHAADGVHLNDVGQLAMAYAILKGLGAPADVSLVTIDARGRKVVEAKGCEVSDLEIGDGRVAFTRLDEHLPFNYGIFYGLNYRFVPVPEELNRYMLRIENVPEGTYQLTVDGRELGTFQTAQLMRGVNIASATADAWRPGGPWDAQAAVLKELTEARHNLALSAVLSNAYLSPKSLPDSFGADIETTDERLVELQRQVAQPKPYRFELRRVEKVAQRKGDVAE